MKSQSDLSGTRRGPGAAAKAPRKMGTRSHAGIAAPRRSDPKMFVDILFGAPLSGIEAVRSIREGYPARILKSASSFFGVPDARIQNIAHVPASTASRLEKNEAKIDAAATERVYRMGTVTRMAIEVLEDEGAAIQWMRQPNRALGDIAPLELMDTEPGAVAVRQVLNAIATGGVA
ncbi:antitoxin Xre/MbcA/ParS toxin-binding domain-containing protein [Noviherbaspirillum sp. 1P10PC]|uniref:type II RES/Xre toxin-antitoxin system antitoxin n=1 Tax=Noviherbaspirillum sp. 1P10PC TaxID=3132292 RepID=UPI0039A0EF6B